MCIFEVRWHKVHPPAIKTIDMNTGLLSYYQPKVWEKKKKLVLGGTILKKGKFQNKYIVSLT